MKKQTNKTNWWIDGILFVGFVLAFFLDLTGLELHQWGGLFICVLALYHLLRHWKWVVNILQRFFSHDTGSQRVRFLVDLFLLFGFELILLTGLMISSWFELPLKDYLLVRNVHVISSISSLVLIVIKIALHTRWITSTMHKIFRHAVAPQAVLPATSLSTASAKSLERREVLRLMGVVGTASLAAILIGGSTTFNSMFEENQGIENDPNPTASPTPETSPTPTATETSTATLSDSQVHNQRRNRGQSESTATPTTANQEYTIPQVTATPIPTSTSSTSPCIVRCPQGCAYPGSCRRYVDANYNNLCDLGECL